MKPKKSTSGVHPDIRSFFSSSPVGPTTTKSKPRASPFSSSSRRASGIGTPSTAAGTPPSPARSLANNTPATHASTPSSAAAASTSNKRAASAALTPGRARKTPPPRPSPASSQGEVISLTGSPIPLRSQLGSASPGTAAASLLGFAEKENGADARSKPAAVSSTATAAVTTAAAAATPPAQMSGYFLEGPTVPARGGNSGGGAGGGSQGSGDGDGCRNLPLARYALPLGEVVVGRDSVRDNSPANKNKLRIGIDKREEGVSRSQATLKAYVPAGRVLVVHKHGAINGIRIIRWAASPGITTAEKVERRANPAAAAKALRAGQLLQAGQQSYLYPGDTLQLDGFRSPASSTCSYVLHPLPRGWTAPLLRSGSIGGGSGSGSRPTTPVTSPRRNSTQVARKPSPVPAVAGGIVTRRGTTPKSAGGAAAGARGGAATTPAPSSLPPRASSTGKARAVAAARSPATAAAAAAASSATDGVLPSPAADENTVKKRLRMSLGGAGRSSSDGSAAGASVSIATPPSTAGRLDCPSPTEAEAPSSGANKRTRPEEKEENAALVASPPRSSPSSSTTTSRKASATSTPTRAARSAAAPGSASAGSSKRLKGAGTSAPAAAGGAVHTLRPAAGAVSGLAGVNPATDGGGGGAAAATAATVPVGTAAESTSVAAAAAAPAASAAATAAASGDSSPSPAPKVPATPRERAAQRASGGKGDGGEGAHEGGSGSGAGRAKWKKGDFVVLRAQVSKGVNKLGGVARVLSVFDDGTYLVKLSLGGAGATRVSSDLLFSYTPSPDKSIRGRRSTSRRRDSGESREVDPSNGWMSPSSTSSSSSSPALSTASSSSRPQRTKKERRGSSGSRKVEESAAPTSGRKAQDRAGSSTRGSKAGGKAAASTRENKGGNRSARRSSSDTGGAAGAAASAADASDAEVITARPGDRARVLYDETDWYMATVVAVHRHATVTVRFDDGSDSRVTLAPGDAEICADGALAPTPPASSSSSGPPTPTSSRSRGGGSSNRSPRPSRKRAAEKAVRVLGPGGRVLCEGEGLALTEQRARALLDTAPERLVGMMYHEKHPGYGGWWETFVTEVSRERVGDGGGGGGGSGKSNDVTNKLWPESVTVGQMERSATTGEAAAKKDEEPDFVYTRKIGAFLGRLRKWDKHREAEWEATLEKERDEGETADATAQAKPSPSAKRVAKKELPPASRPALRDAKKKAVAPAAATAARSRSGSVAAHKAAAPKRKTPAPKVAACESARELAAPPTAACPVPTTAEGVDGWQRSASHEDGGTKEVEKENAVKQTKASIKKQEAAQKKEAAQQRALPTCPFCHCEFYITETQYEIDRHLSSCASRPKPTTVVVSKSTPMPTSLSSSLMIGLKGEDLGSLVASVEEFAARGFRPTVPFCDRVMQEIFSSRCHYQTEYLRRLMTSSLEAFPECWQPLNWSRFEETLQELVVGQENLALNARVTYLDIALDCVEASRRRGQQPQLFLGAGGDRDGRTALKRCSQWAAKVWARRHTGVTPSPSSGGGGSSSSCAKGSSGYRDDRMNARVCMVVSRAVAEALEAFHMAGGSGGVGGGGGGSLQKELEGCQLVAVELESHAETKEAEGTARCRAGLMRSLAGRPFCPTLAGVLLQNMPVQETEGGVEVERLKALLRRQQAKGVSGGGGVEEGRKSTRVGGAKAAKSGSAMLLADMEAGG
eukprot:g5985.t1